jgi:ketosteroid isomerase-like protein
MTPLIMGREVLQLWQSLLEQAGAVDIQVRHLGWIHAGDTAIHLVEEHMQDPSASQPTPPIYGMNVFRRNADGWRLLVHQNSPGPPPLVGVPGA